MTGSTDQPPASARQRATLFEELRRRKVLRSAIVYGVAAFTASEVATFLFENFSVPLWANRLLAAMFVAGFPVTMLLSWVFDFESGGIKRTRYRGQSTRAIVAAAVALMLAGTGGLFYLIFPSADEVTGTASNPAGRPDIDAPISTIAVLPFTNMSGNPEDEYFGDGLADTILNELHKLERLSLIARTSSFSYKGRDVDVRTIGAELNAGALLEGSVQRGGGKLRIIAQLIETASGTHLWSETFDRPAEDLFAIQDEIASAVASALNREIGSSLRAKGERPPSGSLAAYDAYLKAKEFRRGLDQQRVERAAAYFERATVEDPDYAVAWAGLAESRLMAAYLGRYPFADFTNDPLKTQSVWYALPYLYADLTEVGNFSEPLLRAQSLAPELPRVLLAQAIISARQFDVDSAIVPLRQILDLDPDHPEALQLYALTLRHLHRYAESHPFIERAMALDPRSIEIQVDAIMALSYAGGRQESMRRYEGLIRYYPEYRSIIGKDYLFITIGEGAPATALRRAEEMGLDDYGGLRLTASHVLGFTAMLDSLAPADLARLNVQPGFNHLTAFLTHWMAQGRNDDLLASLPYIHQWAEIWPSPGAHAHAARVQVSLGRYEQALVDLHRAGSAFPEWLDWTVNTALMDNLMPYMDGLTMALVLARLGRADESERYLDRVLGTLDWISRNGGRPPLVQAVEAKALYLDGRRDEALAVLEEGLATDLLMPPGMDLEWRAVFGDDPAILAFEEAMDRRRSTLRAGVPEPDLTDYLASGDFLMPRKVLH